MTSKHTPSGSWTFQGPCGPPQGRLTVRRARRTLAVMSNSDLSGQTVAFDGDRVRDLVAELARDADLSRFIL